MQAGAPVVQADAAETFCPGGVYVLANRDNGRTYVGCAGVSFFHRLRQHNREITGGAKATAGSRTWYHALLVTGFADRHKALSFEWYVKRYKWFEPGAWHGVRRQDPIGRHRRKVELLLQKFGTDKFPGLVLHDVAPLSADVAAGCLCFDCAAAGARKMAKNKGRGIAHSTVRGTVHGTVHGNA
jgi:predicted GIY-YIG superfamily endonuclease